MKNYKIKIETKPKSELHSSNLEIINYDMVKEAANLPIDEKREWFRQLLAFVESSMTHRCEFSNFARNIDGFQDVKADNMTSAAIAETYEESLEFSKIAKDKRYLETTTPLQRTTSRHRRIMHGWDGI